MTPTTTLILVSLLAVAPTHASAKKGKKIEKSPGYSSESVEGVKNLFTSKEESPKPVTSPKTYAGVLTDPAPSTTTPSSLDTPSIPRPNELEQKQKRTWDWDEKPAVTVPAGSGFYAKRALLKEMSTPTSELSKYLEKGTALQIFKASSATLRNIKHRQIMHNRQAARLKKQALDIENRQKETAKKVALQLSQIKTELGILEINQATALETHNKQRAILRFKPLTPADKEHPGYIKPSTSSLSAPTKDTLLKSTEPEPAPSKESSKLESKSPGSWSITSLFSSTPAPAKK